MDLTTATPTDIDTILADVYTREYPVAAQVRDHELALRKAEQTGGRRTYGQPDWARLADRARTELPALREKLNAFRAERAPYEAEYDRRGGWSRFYLAQSSNGHIHSSMGCSTCNHRGIPTQFSWLPGLSGLSEADAVAAEGAILCSTCFTSAPVEWTNGVSKAEAAKKASKCPGSGQKFHDDLPHRTGYAAGNYGTCHECGAEVAVTSLGKLRAHKPQA